MFQSWNLEASKVPGEGMWKETLNYQNTEQSNKTGRSVSLDIKEYKMYCTRNTVSQHLQIYALKVRPRPDLDA